jgi:hypothetical protein
VYVFHRMWVILNSLSVCIYNRIIFFGIYVSVVAGGGEPKEPVDQVLLFLKKSVPITDFRTSPKTNSDETQAGTPLPPPCPQPDALCVGLDESLGAPMQGLHRLAHVAHNLHRPRKASVPLYSAVHNQVPPPLVQDAAELAVQDHLGQLLNHLPGNETDRGTETQRLSGDVEGEAGGVIARLDNTGSAPLEARQQRNACRCSSPCVQAG